MKKIIAGCVFLMGLMLSIAVRADDRPEFKFDKETHDFGKIPQGNPVSVDFEFTNVGKEPLTIFDVKATCGCTIANFTKTPVLEGGKGTITITFNAASPMPFVKGIEVKSNSKTPSKQLYIKGEVVAP